MGQIVPFVPVLPLDRLSPNIICLWVTTLEVNLWDTRSMTLRLKLTHRMQETQLLKISEGNCTLFETQASHPRGYRGFTLREFLPFAAAHNNINMPTTDPLHQPQVVMELFILRGIRECTRIDNALNVEELPFLSAPFPGGTPDEKRRNCVMYAMESYLFADLRNQLVNDANSQYALMLGNAIRRMIQTQLHAYPDDIDQARVSQRQDFVDMLRGNHFDLFPVVIPGHENDLNRGPDGAADPLFFGLIDSRGAPWRYTRIETQVSFRSSKEVK